MSVTPADIAELTNDVRRTLRSIKRQLVVLIAVTAVNLVLVVIG